MVSFIKEAQYKTLMRQKGVKRMFRTSRERLRSDLRAYAVLLDVVAKSAAQAQGRRIVSPEHVQMAVAILRDFSA